ncbi:unnamed protein product [Ectocarpus sp. CCAP 1310/34]|nr:unnamed protein product [Ectocarpus sp. CCAP 1310/34]
MPAMMLAAVLTTAAAVSAAFLDYFVVANQQQRGAASHGRPPRRRRHHYQVNRQQRQRRRRRQRPLAGGGVSCGSSAEETTSNAAPTQHEEKEVNEEEQDWSSRHGEVATAAAVPSGGVMAAAVPDDGRPETPATPAVFNDLVLILDAPALPPAPWKLPNLPEENDASCTGGTTTDLSPSRGCDLSPGFHLSAPWSPSKGRARYDRRRSPVSNRPRTFSEYSAGPVSGPVPPPSLLHERSTSDGPGLSIVTWASLSLAGEGGGGGGGLRDRRTRSFTYGGRDRDLFAEWSGGIGGCPAREESRSRSDASRNVHLPKASGGSPSGSGKVDSGGGERVEGSSAGGSRSPLRECHRASQTLPVS